MTDTPMTPDRLAEIRNRNLDEVTSGPWLLADDENGRPLVYAERVGGHGRTLAPLFLAGAATEADAQFVASARQSVPELLAEVDRLRARIAELEALKPARFQDCQVCGAGYEYGQACSACEFNKQMAAATGEARQARDLRPGAAAARRMLRRPGACFTCGDVPDEWCPDCACCKAGCDGGRTNNPCTHPNAPWNTEPTP
ncbi:hypothetical protein ACUN3E_38095 [Streptomyces sp. Ju416(a)]|uniref:hypothetical protein n=1 Tax=Streptomyces sp. Ju416(a) TaxID=3446591 RepID=UPI00403DBF97